MKKILLFVLLICTSAAAFANGGIAHMFLAKQTIAQLPNPALQTLLKDNYDAYLVGAYYPDSGYLGANTYGELSHWDPFIFAFADYLKEKYTNPVQQNPKLVAFLFGIATHRVTDEISHFTFYPLIADHDFPNDNKKTHDYSDMGIDLLVNVDQSLWLIQPKAWWIPVKDLLAIYKRLGENHTSKENIVNGMSLLFLAGYAERAIAEPLYYYIEWKMPWTSAHYYNWPQGGMLLEEQKVMAYQLQLWDRLTAGSRRPSLNLSARKADAPNIATQPTMQLAHSLITDHIITLTSDTNPEDGSVTIHDPIIDKLTLFNERIAAFIKKIAAQL